MSSVGARLRSARERKGWSQTYVCKKLGIPNSTLSGYERDYRTPDPDWIRKFAELYEVTTDYLLGRTDDPTPNIDQVDDNDSEQAKTNNIVNLDDKKKEYRIGTHVLTAEEMQQVRRFIKKYLLDAKDDKSTN